jgi:hypothetical protein
MMKDMGVEYVIESTGLFVEAEKVLLFKKILLLMAVVFCKNMCTHWFPKLQFFKGFVILS